MGTERGIDVSTYQGSINWAKVKATGITFAILKATKKNNTTENSFEANYVGCVTSGIKVGVYRYVYAKSVAEAKAEAEALVKVLKDKTISCGVWLDMEDASIKGLGKAKLTAIIQAETEILNLNGYSVGIYCNVDWYNNVLDSKLLKETYPFWIARYKANDIGVLDLNWSGNPKDIAVAWQYSSKGTVNGITGNVDMNYAFIELDTVFKKQSYYPQLTLLNALTAVGETDTSYANRKKIAIANGITNYTGSYEQNNSLLKLIIDGKLLKS